MDHSREPRHVLRGWGFFDLLKDERFAAQNGASYFLLENTDWQLFGLDSSYDPRDLTGNTGELYGEQATWLAQERAAKPNKKCALLTHHQPFCAYNEVPENLTRRLKPIQAAGQIDAWFWGHEHLCAVYDAHQGIRFPVLLGHGGFPQSPKPKVASPPPIAFEWTDTWSHKDPNASVLFGFAVLDLAGAAIGVRLIDLFGNEKYRFLIA